MLDLAQSGIAVPSSIADALVDAVLRDAPEAVRLALAVQGGGEHATRRLIDLAASVLRDDADEGLASDEGAH